MPTICREQGFRIVIYPADHRPAHVHVMRAGSEAVFHMNCPDGPPSLRENRGFDGPTLNRIKSRLMGCLDRLCQAWREIHGNYR